MSQLFLENKSCVDASFGLKFAFTIDKSFGHNSYILFIDSVKAFKMVDRDLMFKIL